MQSNDLGSPFVQVPGYVDLQRDIHHALLAQHPEWIMPNGDSPTCDSYDARFAELLARLAPGGTSELKQRNAPQLEFQYA
jgi:hypothetical protein